ncbi:uncharacterized protein TNCV_1833591 [Trichonephila clavipes]|nr:uncharacterized protein TNCV_1833591 [Trichonephila clavipes]
MDVCKCIMPSRHGDSLNNRRVASLLVRLVEGEERLNVPDHPQGVLPQNWGETELNRPVTCMVLKATANDRRHLALCHDEFCDLDLAFADEVALLTTTTNQYWIEIFKTEFRIVELIFFAFELSFLH